ncbi:extracellular elastinolytic metallo proteinase [Pleurotus eryngii]|uniref:Extracellular metalloproteinase n=1 Tax=Pleurotus eryngii TaxID=5323 RepID=A0A9P5ZTE7_PLEER|nr:extracellular elastinolytic metallo proteinase [Pleurotus eryngii]
MDDKARVAYAALLDFDPPPSHSTTFERPIFRSFVSFTAVTEFQLLSSSFLMRTFFATSLLIAGLAGGVFGHAPVNGGEVRRRKSLGFGPELPHAKFHANPYQIQTNGFMPMGSASDPFEVATAFLGDLLSGQTGLNSRYKIRKDSYTDANTGVTHVYVRQMVNGLEVADGDINLNIKDGMVLSYGNSFYTGPTDDLSSSLIGDVRHPHREHCETLLAELQLRVAERYSSGEQLPMSSPGSVDEDELAHLVESNCAFVDLPYDLASKGFVSQEAVDDPRAALLQFMVAATPNQDVVQDVLSNFDAHFEKMSVSVVHHFDDPESAPPFEISNVPDTVNPVKARLAYVQVPNKASDSTELNLVWKFEVEMSDNWYEAAVSAAAPHRIVSVVDWASDAPIPKPKPGAPATYNVFAWGINDPSEGKRSIETENVDALASPWGWHALPVANDPSMKGVRLSSPKAIRNTTSTWGNNVFAHENWEGQNSWINNYRPEGHKGNVFDFPYDPQATNKTAALGEAKKFIDIAVTQLFYTSNLVHDLYYRYGFDEVAGNFQQHNFGRGGAENDAVIANAQDGSGFNNANFMTPPDGQNGRCRMYLWNTANPYRDGDLEAGIVIHELSHGLSTRLTGGPANSGCLGWGESGGMGEGWGDFLATTIRSTKHYSDYSMGSWAANREQGIRNFIYSLNETVNPSTYKTLDKPGYWGVHAIGEVWAEILWVVSNGLIDVHGFSDSLFPPAPSEDGTVPEGDFYRPAEYTSAGKKKPLIPKHGNTLSIQLVLNGMKLQPCRPSFFEARDAIIQADQILTGGENFCTLWTGFSKRGLGPDSRVDGRTPWGGGIRTDDYDLPSKCKTA